MGTRSMCICPQPAQGEILVSEEESPGAKPLGLCVHSLHLLLGLCCSYLHLCFPNLSIFVLADSPLSPPTTLKLRLLFQGWGPLEILLVSSSPCPPQRDQGHTTTQEPASAASRWQASSNSNSSLCPSSVLKIFSPWSCPIL